MLNSVQVSASDRMESWAEILGRETGPRSWAHHKVLSNAQADEEYVLLYEEHDYVLNTQAVLATVVTTPLRVDLDPRKNNVCGKVS